MTDTKERILQTALRLFAAEGYEAVSVSDIAGALGITKGALYRHYKNKRDVFDSILLRMEQRDAAQAETFDLPVLPPGQSEEAYRNASVDRIVDFSKAMFRYWTGDAFASQFRRMLTVEQYRSREMEALFQQYLGAGPLRYVTELFRGLRLPEAEGLAAGFYGPMFLLCSVWDAAEDKQAVLAQLDAFMEDARRKLKGETEHG